MRNLAPAFAIAGIVAGSANVSRSATVSFDFDSGAPVLSAGTSLPISQTVGNLTAAFSSPAGPAFSIQNEATTFLPLSLFSGNYLYPNTLERNLLAINFDQAATGISLHFATVDTRDPEIPSFIELTALINNVPIGPPATATSVFIEGDAYPQGMLTYDAGGGSFDSVTLLLPFQATGATTFLIDGISVTTRDVAVIP
jgi:hypothetical protein